MRISFIVRRVLMSNPKARANKKTKQKQIRKNRRTGIFVGVGVLVATVVVFSAAALGAPAMIAEIFNTTLEEVSSVEAETPSAWSADSGAIADGIFIDGVNVSGLTRDEALEKLENEVRAVQLQNEISFRHDESVFIRRFGDFDITYDFMLAISFAYTIDRDREISRPLELVSEVTYDYETVADVLSWISNIINIEAQNATMVRENGEFVITPEVVGFEVDHEHLMEDFRAALYNRESTEIVLEVVETVPELTEAIFARSTNRLGSFYTTISGYDPGRNQNLLNASYKINNYIVMPGEIFSTNRAFGEMTYENGYRLAPVIVNGQLVPGMGGGICQVSSGLYIALVFSELRIVERLNHSMRVAYADYGWDATLATDLIDLRFENDTDYPVMIVAYIMNNRSYVHIYGHESRPAGRRLELFSTVTERIPAPEETVIEVATLAPGVRETISPSRQGVVAELHKIVFDGDTELYRQRVNVSRYRERSAIVHVGAGAIEPPAPPVEPPVPPVEPPAPPVEPPAPPVEPPAPPVEPPAPPVEPPAPPVEPPAPPVEPPAPPVEPPAPPIEPPAPPVEPPAPPQQEPDYYDEPPPIIID